MLQFVFNLIQSLVVMFHEDFGYPKFLATLLLIYMISLLILFGNFYMKNLASKKKEDQKKKE